MIPMNKIFSVLGMLWALPISALAFLLVLLLRPTGTRWAILRYGNTPALVAWGGGLNFILSHLPFGAASGMTLGHVVWFTHRWAVRPIGAHEFAHVRQYACWGVFFLPAYFFESAWQWLRGRHYYWDNRFEVAAYRCGRERFCRRTSQ